MFVSRGLTVVSPWNAERDGCRVLLLLLLSRVSSYPIQL